MEDQVLPISDRYRADAFSLLERNIAAVVEQARKAVTGEVGRLHNELPDGVKVPTSRMEAWLSQAQTEIFSHQQFIQRRENYSGLTPAVTFEIKKKLVESYLATANAASEIAPQLKKEALDIIERDIVAVIEKSRSSVTGEVGRLHNELPDGVKVPTSRVEALLGQAQTEAAAHQQFIQRREEYAGEAPAVTFEIKKKLVESYLATANAAPEIAPQLKKEALDTIERDIVAVIEKSRSSITGEVGRLHNELPTGLKVPTERMTKLLNQAVSDAIAHQRFLARSDDDEITPPPISFEVKKILVESYLASGQTELALGLKKSALDLIQRDMETQDQTVRRETRYTLTLSSPQSYGYVWGRVGLGFDEALTFSNNAIKRAVTSAEESLMNSGKWVGTIGEYALTLSNSGEVFLPREIETVLFVSFDGNPRPVHDRYAEYLTGGTGIKTTENPGRSGFSDLGDAVDSTDGKTKRKYWVTVPQEGTETLIRYLAKRRFVPHTSDAESMYLNNYEAVAQAAMAILTNGKIGNFESAKQLLAAQVHQQYFKAQVSGVHNKRVLAIR